MWYKEPENSGKESVGVIGETLEEEDEVLSDFRCEPGGGGMGSLRI